MNSSNMLGLVADYLDLRHALGYSLKMQGALLRSFARYADGSGHSGPLTIDLALRWAELSESGPDQIARRLSIVRQFARYRVAFDLATEVPPSDLLPCPKRRRTPHIYSDMEFADLLEASAGLRPRAGLRSKTYGAFFSLLISTGLRCGEARHLTLSDVDLDNSVLLVREGKARKSRLVPLHPTTTAALTRYAALRDSYTHLPSSEFFLRTDHAPSLGASAVEQTFAYIRGKLGWTADGRAHLPRIHDMRHTFAVRRLLRWYEEGADVDQKILALSTYLGHTNVSDTYWYLSGVPELMAVTSLCFEEFAQSEEERLP